MRYARSIRALLIALLLPLGAQAQPAAWPDSTARPINAATLVALGSMKLRNNYFADAATAYNGVGLQLIDERMRLSRWGDGRLVAQRTLRLQLATTHNTTGTINVFAGFADWSGTLYYRFRPAAGLRVMVGPSVRMQLGTMYNTQSANNTTTLHTGADLNLAAAMTYTLFVKRNPLTLRWQADVPLAGLLFAPGYGQSYYEIFTLKHTAGVVAFSSLHNHWGVRHWLTADVPVGSVTLRIGYLGDVARTSVKGLTVTRTSHSAVIGIAKEFIAFGNHRHRPPNLRSAYY